MGAVSIMVKCSMSNVQQFFWHFFLSSIIISVNIKTFGRKKLGINITFLKQNCIFRCTHSLKKLMRNSSSDRCLANFKV